MGHENALHMTIVRGRNEILRNKACISFFTSSCACALYWSNLRARGEQ